jgi:hypothetical protein
MFKKILILNLLVISGAFSPAFAQEYNEEFIAGEIGRLSAIYPGYAACAGSARAKANFATLKENMTPLVGGDKVAQMQQNYDKVERVLAEYAPSIREKTSKDMDCVRLEQTTAEKLDKLFTDLTWYLTKRNTGAKK